CGLFLQRNNRDRLPFFGTVKFNLWGDDLPEVSPAACVRAYADTRFARPNHVTGTLLFDVWIANGDRHVRNLALDTTVTPHQLHVFDHSHALFGSEGGRGAARLGRLRTEALGVAETTDPSGNRHCLLDAVKTNKHFPEWLKRIREVPE